MNQRIFIRSAILLVTLAALALTLMVWKYASLHNANATPLNPQEPMESVTVALAKQVEHRPTTTSIGTILALRSVTLKNELAGTVRQVMLTPGQIVEPDTLLVALDVSVEEAELKAQEAQASLADTMFRRNERLIKMRAIPAMDFDRSQAERDVAQAQIARIKAIIARKTIRAPFRARVGISDVHPGQYLNEGTQLTTLQGVDDGLHADFTVAQRVAEGLKPGDSVEIFAAADSPPISAKIVATDARVDPTTRNATVRAKIEDGANAPAPGASVRVQVPVGPPRTAVTIPVSAVRKGPGGDHVFVIVTDKKGKARAQTRQVLSGVTLGDEIVIHEGLTPGEKVAASGSFKLRDSVQVAISAESAPSTSGAK